MTNSLSKRIALVLLTIAVTVMPARAQKLQASLSHYSTDNGLASNAIAYMTKDDYGYIWIATWNGLSRFDGYNFYNYKTGTASHIPNMHNRIIDIAVDQPQNVWMRMYDGRVFVVNRQTDKMEDPLAGVGQQDELRTNNPLAVTTGGDVLVSFGAAGIYHFRLDRSGLRQQHIMTGGLVVNAVVEGYQSDLWAATNQGIHRINMSNLSLERKGYFLDEDIACLYSNGYNVFGGTRSGKIVLFAYGQEPKVVREVGEEITGIFVDSHGLLWYSDKGDGVCRLNMDTNDMKRYTQRVLVPEFTGQGAMFNETMGYVWIRLNHGGYGYYNRETDELEYFHNDPSNPWNLSNTVNSSIELDEGVVWESTSRRGLEKLEILKNTIVRNLLVPGAESSLENEVRAMYYDRERHLLFLGNKKNSLFVFDKEGNRKEINNDNEGHPIGRPYGMSRDSKGNYWVSSKDYGLFKMTPKGEGYDITRIGHDDSDQMSLSSNSAYETVEDRKGNIWVATYGGGVNIVRKNKAGRYESLHYKNKIKNYPINSYLKVRTVEMDSEGKIWAGTTDGILIMELKGNEVTIDRLRQPQSNPEDGLQCNDIVCMRRDRNGNMWVGTNGGGLSCTKGKDADDNWLFNNYGAADGLPSEEIHSITFDLQNNVWFATDHILCSYDVKKGIFTTFSNLDGVDDTMCSEGAAICLSNGNILFGTINGYYVVDRKKLSTSTGSLLKLRITDFYIDDVLQTPRLTDTYDYYVPESRRVELPSHGSVFSFRFAALNYQLQHRVHYQYMLEGYDDEWRNVDKSRQVSFSGIPAGTYRFKVKAFLLESPENYDMRVIDVVVPPYAVLSTAAIWVYLFIVLAAVLFAIFWYQAKIARQYAAENAAAETEETVEVLEENNAVGEESPATEVTDDFEIIE